MNKWRWLLLIILCLAGVGFAIFSVQQAQNRTAPVLLNNPSRIVSLAPNLTEILFALRLDNKIVGVTVHSDYPPAAIKKPKVGSFWQPDIEAVIAAKPDLVITLWFEQHKSIADSLNRLGYQVLSLRIGKVEELLASIQKIGTATDCKRRADELVENISNQLNDLQLKLSSTNKVRMLWVAQVEPLRVAGRNTFINEFLELAGGENAIGPTIQQYPLIGTEELLACGAEVILQSATGTGNIDKQQQAAQAFWSRWANLPAVKNNRIYIVEPDTIERLGPRLCLGIETIARCLHPDIFTQTHDVTQ
ncbi:MAG: ABC transporter substrate-binding protein [Planctomycetota bacterium]